MWYENLDVCQYLAAGVEKFDLAELDLLNHGN